MSTHERSCGPLTRSRAVFGDSTNTTNKPLSTRCRRTRSSVCYELPLQKPSNPTSMELGKAQPLHSAGSQKLISLPLPTRKAKGDASQQLKWANMTPLEWINDLQEKAQMAEERMEGETLLPAQEARYEPNVIPSADGSVPTTPVRSLPSDVCASGGSYDPWRDLFSPVAGLDPLPHGLFPVLSKVDPGAMPLFWDLGSLPPGPTVDRIRLLVLAIESHNKFPDLKPALEHIRDHFTFSQSYARQKGQFDILCVETTHRLTSLLTLLVNSVVDNAETSLSMQATPLASNVAQCKVRASPSTPNKAAFQLHMTNWLRANWINPYPDEAVTHQLAYETGESPHVVNTWLVNARSRRWRPSILRAFDLKRPSESLLEDSILLFDEKPLRPIGEETEVEEGATKRSRFY